MLLNPKYRTTMTSNKKRKTKRNYSSTNKNSPLFLLGDNEVSEGPEVGKGVDAVVGPDHATPEWSDPGTNGSRGRSWYLPASRVTWRS